MGSRSGFYVVGSKQDKDKDKDKEDCDAGLGLRMHDQPYYKEVMGVSHHRHHHEPSPLLSGGGGDGGGGPIFYGTRNRIACFGDIYDVVGAAAAASGDAAAFTKTTFYHFSTDSSTSSSSSSSFAFNLPGEMTPSMTVVGVPFTAAQWQELERQAMIFKYMMASVPVPPELLVPITRSQSNIVPSSQSNMVRSSLEMGISSNSSDPEPWRCKRTDGKKWRCSRDVVPDQKYCERHSHKSRHRSRKPVELHTDSTSNTPMYTFTRTRLPNKKSQLSTQTNCNLSISPIAMVSAATSPYDQPRSLEWFLKGENDPVGSNSSKEWNYMKRDDIQQHYREDSNSHMHLGHGQALQPQPLIDWCSLLSSTPTSQAQETRQFLDGWSSTGLREKNTSGIEEFCSSVSSSGEKLLPFSSSRTLSMCGGGEGGEGSETDQESENARIGNFGVVSHGSWMGSPPGGPLAEALCLGISSCSKAASDLSSPHSS